MEFRFRKNFWWLFLTCQRLNNENYSLNILQLFSITGMPLWWKPAVWRRISGTLWMGIWLRYVSLMSSNAIHDITKLLYYVEIRKMLELFMAKSKLVYERLRSILFFNVKLENVLTIHNKTYIRDLFCCIYIRSLPISSMLLSV